MPPYANRGGTIYIGGRRMATDNLILYDWLSFTVRDFEPEAVLDLLRLKEWNWELKPGFYGYRQRYCVPGISVHFDGFDNQGVLCEMSGSGCRYFESHSDYGALGWNTFFFALEHLPPSCRLRYTRLDIAFDDHEGIIPLDKLIQDTLDNHWVSSFRWAEVAIGSGDNHGKAVYFGSPQSEARIRIYDKAAERHAEGEGHWVRVELQLRRDRATRFLERRDQGLTDLFAGVLVNYLRFVSPSSDSNKSRWPMTDYWQYLIHGVSRVRIFSSPGEEYNRDRLECFVYHQVANAVWTAWRLDGYSFFSKVQELQHKSGGLPDKYAKLLIDEIPEILGS